MADLFTPGPDYDAALWGATVGVRRDRGFLEVTGRAPRDMLNGLLTNSLPSPPVGEAGGALSGSVVYSALLDPKGKMITDLRVFCSSKDGIILDLPSVGFDGARAHFQKFLPPRLAKVENRSDYLTLLTLMGPEAPALLARVASQLGVSGPVEGMGRLREGEELLLPSSRGENFRVIRNGESHADGWDLLLPAAVSEEVRDRLDAGGAVPLSAQTLGILRLEKGRPTFGKDMDESTIPLEAGIQSRAVDDGKGCYTGQEVIIRIRDRGHVNKELRGLLLEELPVQDRGGELFQPNRDKSIGWITSSVFSPAFGQSIALGYLRRGVDPGAEVRVGSMDGPRAQVRALGQEGWITPFP